MIMGASASNIEDELVVYDENFSRRDVKRDVLAKSSFCSAF